jgi:hypothetical protein
VTPECLRCDDCGWICETHPNRPCQGPRACDCGAAGNQAEGHEQPRRPFTPDDETTRY